METIMQQVQHVIKFFFLIVVFISFFSCNEKKDNQDEKLLKTFLEDYKKNNGLDSVFLETNNSNYEIVERLKRISKLNSSKEEDSIFNMIVSNKEITQYEKQVSKDENWAINISLSKNVFYDSIKIGRLHVTKPIYTINKKYALIYSYRTTKKGVIFYPPVDIYFLRNSNWNKVYKLKDNGF